MSEHNDDQIQQLMDVFHQFARAGWRKGTVLGLKASEVRVLACLKRRHDNGQFRMTVSEISKTLQVTSPTVTQMAGSLLKAGYIERSADPNDRRITEITLTDKGHNLAEQAIKRHHNIFRGMIDKLGKEQSSQLIALLREVFDYLEETAEADFNETPPQ
jgi:DNA-binding MarR family transcriptional regulator